MVGAGAHEVGQEAESGVCSAQREGKEETLLWSAAAQWDRSWRYHDGMRGTKCNKGNSNWVLGKKKKSPLEGDQTLEEDPDKSLLLEIVKTHPAKALSNLF